MRINVRRLVERVGNLFLGRPHKKKRKTKAKERKTKEKTTTKKVTRSKITKKTTKISKTKKIKKTTKKKKTTKTKRSTIKRNVQMKNTLLKNSLINEFLITIAGENATRVVGELVNPIQDEDIAKKTRLKVTVVRSVLNKLHAAGVTDYSRTKDKKTGWFSYVWRLRFDNMVNALKRKKQEEMEFINRQLSEESSYIYYSCKKSCVKVPFDQAMELMFRCPKCNGLLYSMSNKRKIKSLQLKQSKLMQELSQLDKLSAKFK